MSSFPYERLLARRRNIFAVSLFDNVYDAIDKVCFSRSAFHLLLFFSRQFLLSYGQVFDFRPSFFGLRLFTHCFTPFLIAADALTLTRRFAYLLPRHHLYTPKKLSVNVFAEALRGMA